MRSGFSASGSSDSPAREVTRRPPEEAASGRRPPALRVNSAWLVCFSFLIVEPPLLSPPSAHTAPPPRPGVRTTARCSSAETRQKSLWDAETRGPSRLLETRREKGLFFFFFFNWTFEKLETENKNDL